MTIDFDLIYKILAIIEQLAGHPQATQLKAAALAQLSDIEAQVAEDNKKKAEEKAKKDQAEAEAKAKKEQAEAEAEAKKTAKEGKHAA
jgi:hypothetical protein